MINNQIPEKGINAAAPFISAGRQAIPPAKTAVKPYELELSLFFVVALSGVYIAYEIMAEPSGGHLFGHTLGIIGTVLMVMTELLYSLRKRTSLMNWAGPVRYWLSFHIFTGIVGPALVLMHTGMAFRGLAGISFLLTVTVVGSGFIGRYLYTALPRKLTGVSATRREIDAEAIEIQRTLTQFEAQKPAQVRQLMDQLGRRPPPQSHSNPVRAHVLPVALSALHPPGAASDGAVGNIAPQAVGATVCPQA